MSQKEQPSLDENDARRAKKAHLSHLRNLVGNSKLEGRKQFTTFQERSPLYEDVRSLLSPGFISKSISINGVNIGLRTLNYEDLLLVEARTGLGSEDWVDWILATSIWVFGGQLIKKDQEALMFLFEKLKTFSSSIKSQLMITLAILNSKFSKARERALSYFYERESRDLWMSRRLTLFSGEFEWVGRNAIQDLWAFYNTMEDERIKRIFDQNMAGFQVSPHAPASIKKMSARAKRDEEQLEKERGIAQDKMFFNAFGVDFDPKRYRQFKIDEVIKAETFEELEQEMKNWAMGKKDKHDLVVEVTQRRIKTERQFRKWKQEKLRRESEEKARIAREQGDNRTSVVLVGEEANKLLEEFAKQAAQPSKTFDIPNDTVYDKYLGSDSNITKLTLDEYGKVVNKIPEEMREFFTQEVLTALNGNNS